MTRSYRFFRDLLLQKMADHDEQIDQDSAGQSRVHETGPAGGRVQPRRVRADGQTDAGQAQYLKTPRKKEKRDSRVCILCVL